MRARLRSRSLVLVTIRKGVGVGVVEQALVALAPREPLVTDAQMLILDELRLGMAVLFLVLQVCIQHAQADRWHGHEKGQLLPYLVTAGCQRGKYANKKMAIVSFIIM